MPKANKQFHLHAQAVALGNRRGEVKVYSGISTWKWDEDDPTVTSNDFDKQLKALGDVDEIVVRINSPGGVVTEAIAIRTALMKHKAAKIIDIEGCRDSAATLIACMPGAKVRMAQGGEYMIHCCSAIAWGQKDKILSVYNSMAQTDKDMAGIYAERTGKSVDECMELMQAETWYGAEEAMEAGFVDEIIAGADEDVEIAACAVDADTMELMRSCYAHAPEHTIRAAEGNREPENNPVSNETSAVAAASSTENTQNEGVGNMPELRDATAEQLRQENPTLAQAIANDAVTAERERVREITALTRKGEKWQTMAKKAIADGTSAADFLKAVIAEEEKQGQEYLDTRRNELEAANRVGAGDSKDNDKDDAEAKTDKAAKDIAELAKSMNADGLEMA